MKIILTIGDARGRNVVFVSDSLRSYPLHEAVQRAKDNTFENVYAVERTSGAYLRTLPRVPKEDELAHLAVSPRHLFRFINDASATLSHRALNQYLKLYERTLKIKEGQSFIAIGSIARISKRKAKEKLIAHEEWVFNAAKKFGVDPYLLAAIIIDEIARFDPWEPITDPLSGHFIGFDTSVGIAQVTIETARGLIKDGYYNPNPSDHELSPDKIQKTPRTDLYKYVQQPKYSIFFAAAHMRALIDRWKKSVDLNKKPEIIATLYSIGRGKTPHGNPQPNKRGLQIAGEFYQLAHEWLS